MQSDNKIQNTVNEIDRGLGTIFNPNHLFFANNSVTPNKVVNDINDISINDVIDVRINSGCIKAKVTSKKEVRHD